MPSSLAMTPSRQSDASGKACGGPSYLNPVGVPYVNQRSCDDCPPTENSSSPTAYVSRCAGSLTPVCSGEVCRDDAPRAIATNASPMSKRPRTSVLNPRAPKGASASISSEMYDNCNVRKVSDMNVSPAMSARCSILMRDSFARATLIVTMALIEAVTTTIAMYQGTRSSIIRGARSHSRNTRNPPTHMSSIVAIVAHANEPIATRTAAEGRKVRRRPDIVLQLPGACR